jgi:hypothetical protein
MRLASALPRPKAVQIPTCEGGSRSKGLLVGSLELKVVHIRKLPRGATRKKESNHGGTICPECFTSSFLAFDGVRAPLEALETELA